MIIDPAQGLPDGWRYSGSGLLVPPSVPKRRRVYDRPVGIGFFVGAGGMDLGLHQGGFHMAGAVEYDFAAATTYMCNLARPGVRVHFDTPERGDKFNRFLEQKLAPVKGPGGGLIPTTGLLAGDGWISHQPPDEPGCEHFWVADVRNLTGKQILDALELEVGEVDLCAGGPPCQGFSSAGQRDVMDPRNSLVFEYARLILEIRPKAFILENVPGLLSMVTPEGTPVVDALCRILDDGGFGPYNALKRSLTSGLPEGAKAGMRRNPQPGDKPKKAAPVAASTGDQLDLFGDVA